MTENERVRKARKALGLTTVKFGKALGISNSAVSNIENGIRSVTDQMCRSICREFNVNETWLRTGEGEMFAEPDTFSLDAYAASHGCTDLDIAFLKAFFDLDPDVRSKVLDHFRKSLARRQQQPAAPTDAEARMAAMEKRIEDLEKEEEIAPSPAPAPAQSFSHSH